MRNQKGFTLVELLVVIAIIGILSTLAVVSLGGVRGSARDAKRLSDVNAFRTTMEVLLNDNTGALYPDCSNGYASVAATCAPVLTSYLPGLDKMNDPSFPALTDTKCTGSNTNCNYTFSENAPGTTNDYALYFYLEKGLNNAGTAADTCTLSKSGIVCN